MKQFLQASMPDLPGVYFFKDATNTIIYIGKAKSLKKRVGSYFQSGAKDWKVELMLSQAAWVDHVLTKTESEAMLLEADLINQHKPKFNVLLKDGQPFVYLMITAPKTGLPTLEIVRNKKKRGTYFGPFMKKQQARSIHTFLLRTFQLKLCNKSIATGCLDYHLGLCPGTCKSDFSPAGYLERLGLVAQLLRGDFTAFQQELESRIADCLKTLEYERARNLHKYLENIAYITNALEERFSSDKFATDVAYAASSFARTHINPSEVGKQLQDLFGLPYAPRSIDCFDISHFQGHHIVGSCVRFTDGAPDKKFFRRFRIKTLAGQDDYAALREIASRRYNPLSQNKIETPDLILIDGGIGQLNAVKAVIPPVPCISLAKREETVFTTAGDAVKLDLHTQAGQLLIALRDYAHHFAISYHRSKRNITL